MSRAGCCACSRMKRTKMLTATLRTSVLSPLNSAGAARKRLKNSAHDRTTRPTVRRTIDASCRPRLLIPLARVSALAPASRPRSSPIERHGGRNYCATGAHDAAAWRACTRKVLRPQRLEAHAGTRSWRCTVAHADGRPAQVWLRRRRGCAHARQARSPVRELSRGACTLSTVGGGGGGDGGGDDGGWSPGGSDDGVRLTAHAQRMPATLCDSARTGCPQLTRPCR